ncbi:MAG: phosphate ABC transporter substrate-binding protein [Lachnospiraceae bacterium]|nr:phosphate ABC transporter substrate-binding protein [Lachnospiraceae bacterium]
MKKTIAKIIGLVCMIGLLAGSLMACGGSSSGDDASGSGEDLSGKITIAGSTSMEKVCNALSESFMEKYPNVTVTSEFTGSSAGLESLASGSVDIGNASRSLSKDEADTGAVENVIAIDGIGVITDKDNKIENLTSEELAKIYTGEIKNWKELGQKEEDIVVVGREAGSGTRDAFEELLDIADKCDYVQELDSTGAVLAKVSSTPGAIGYVSLDVVDDTVNLVQLNGVEAVEKNIISGDYVLSRPFVMATKGEISEQSDLVKAWFDYINSDEGQQVIAGQGLFLPQK